MLAERNKTVTEEKKLKRIFSNHCIYIVKRFWRTKTTTVVRKDKVSKS